MTAIKERPILFSAPMVRAILDGRKTVTRRPVKPQPEVRMVDMIGPMLTFKNKRGGHWLYPNAKQQIIADCPYGQAGERLWVREAWQDVHPVQVIDRYSQQGRAGIPGPPGVTYQTIYRADGDYPPVHYTHEHPYRCLEPDPNHGFRGAADSGWTGWTPSIHMPRWACRILLEITDVRVERLQDITPEQITAEGVSTRGEAMWGDQWWVDAPDQAIEDARKDFADLWTSTGGDWETNPWVWCVSFRRVDP